MSHTPGPWAFHRDGSLPSTSPTVSQSMTGRQIAFVTQANSGNQPTRETARANAALIAAAPELLDALIGCCDSIVGNGHMDICSTPDDCHEHDAYNKGLSAIAKARGEA